MLEQQDYEQLGGMIQTIVAGTLEQKLDEKLDEKLDQKLLVFKKNLQGIKRRTKDRTERRIK